MLRGWFYNITWIRKHGILPNHLNVTILHSIVSIEMIEARFIAPLNESPECLTGISSQNVRLSKTNIPFRTFIAFIMSQE